MGGLDALPKMDLQLIIAFAVVFGLGFGVGYAVRERSRRCYCIAATILLSKLPTTAQSLGIDPRSSPHEGGWSCRAPHFE